jgi:hypothetical protein
VALAVAGVVAATVAAEVSRDAAGIETRATRAELRAISSRLEGLHSTILIESSEPVAYVTSQPDPLTVLVDLRNVKAGQLPPGILGPLPPVANVNVEEAVAGDGAPLARVRVGLAHQAKYRRAQRTQRDLRGSRSGASVARRSERHSCRIRRARAAGDSQRDRRKRRHPRRSRGAASPHDCDAGAGDERARQRRRQPANRKRHSFRCPTRSRQPSVRRAPAGAGGSKFTGHTITLDMQGADLRAVLRTFSDISGPEHRDRPVDHGTVDVLLRDVPWDQALDIILKANKLGYAWTAPSSASRRSRRCNRKKKSAAS